MESDRITVSFTKLYGDFGNAYNRDFYNGSWQTTNLIGLGVQSIVVDDNVKTHAFLYEPGDSQPGNPTPYDLVHYSTNLGSSGWSLQNTLVDYGTGGYLPPEEERLSRARSDDNKIHIVYDGSTYKKWDGSQFTDSYTFGNGDNNKISANNNDIYVVWIESGTVKLRQRDFNPLVPASFAGSWDNGNEETGHPKLTWAANTEMDLKEYEVWKKVDDYFGNNIEPWAKKASTTNTSYVDNSEIGWDVMANPRVVYYKVRAVDQSDNYSDYTGTQQFYCNNGPQLNRDKEGPLTLSLLPARFMLEDNYPNPFNPVTVIRYALPEAASVVLEVYNMNGQKIISLQNGTQQAGYHSARFDGGALSSGIYIYRIHGQMLESGKRFSAVKRMLLIK